MPVEPRHMSVWQSAVIQFGLLAVFLGLLFAVLVPFILTTRARHRHPQSPLPPPPTRPARPRVKRRTGSSAPIGHERDEG